MPTELFLLIAIYNNFDILSVAFLIQEADFDSF